MTLPSIEACALIRDALAMYEGPLPVTKLITWLDSEALHSLENKMSMCRFDFTFMGHKMRATIQELRS